MLMVRVLGSRFTLTAEGTLMGCFPMRDIVWSEFWFRNSNRECVSGHNGDNFTADFFLAGLTIAEHAAAGGNDGDAETLDGPRQIADAAVHAASGLGHAVDGVDQPLAALAVPERNVDEALAAVFDHIIGRDITLIPEHLGDAAIELVIQHLDGLGVVA